MELTDGLRDHVADRFHKLGRFLADGARLHVTLTVERNSQIVDVVAKAPHSLFQAQERSADMYTSIDRAAAKLETQLRRHHDKQTDQKARLPRAAGGGDATVPTTLLETLDRVVETREINVQRLPEHEAIRLMDEQDESLWVYRDAFCRIDLIEN
jgi:putative sigma-54 modulation protein